ncbi:HNH endonuclease [Mesorhizobium sp. B2-3-2]|nr:HNH endonuclease [Mesorhizobium sp. B2-3-2]
MTFHGIELLPWARLPLFGRRFRRFFPSISDKVNPDRKPWTSGLVARLAEYVASLNASDFAKDETARAVHVAKKYRKLNRVRSFLLGWEWRQVRYEVLRDRGARCELCGATSADCRIEVDHIKPISKHWDLRLDKANLQILCRDCNMGKGNRSADDFRS